MMFVPFYDHNQLKFIPFQATTWILIAINVAVFIWQQTLAPEALNLFAVHAGVIPASLVGDSAMLPAELQQMRPELTLVTYMFLHGDIWHLLGNMAFLWVFGDNVEDAMGSLRFFVFYLLSGIAAAFAHTFANLGSDVPLIGASGATAGIIAAYLMLYPRVRVWVLAFARIPLRLAAWFVIGSWIVLQFVFIAMGTIDGTALWAHVGGFAAGAALIPIFKRRNQPLFGDGRPT
jgi:membrane associated rhomboid family serine protease